MERKKASKWTPVPGGGKYMQYKIYNIYSHNGKYTYYSFWYKQNYVRKTLKEIKAVIDLEMKIRNQAKRNK